MTSGTFTCPRCLYSGPRDRGARFCPHCGLAIDESSKDGDPIRIAIAGGQTVEVRETLAFGEICNLYHCTIHPAGRAGVFKIARTHEANRHIMHEWETLQRLAKADAQGRYKPFLPAPLASVRYAHSSGEPPRQASVLGYCDGITNPIELYSLEEVRAAYPSGIDARDMAWMWRRLLTILGFVHQQRQVHGGVTPDHVLIEPREHKLVLIGWCGAAAFGQQPQLRPARWREWIHTEHTAAGEADLASAARTMLYLLGPTVEPAIKRHLDRAGESAPDALKLLDDFDQMIEALWGPRQFRAFVMPARG